MTVYLSTVFYVLCEPACFTSINSMLQICLADFLKEEKSGKLDNLKKERLRTTCFSKCLCLHTYSFIALKITNCKCFVESFNSIATSPNQNKNVNRTQNKAFLKFNNFLQM